MNFSQLLEVIKKKHKLKSTTALYEFLGEEKGIGITLRNFNQIFSEVRNPSLKVFVKILNRLEKEDYKDAISAYFESHNEKGSCNKLIDYINKNLSIEIDKDKPGLWDRPISQATQTEKELKYLADNPEASRFLHLLMLKEELNLNFFESKHEIIKKLVELDRAIKTKDKVKSKFTGLRIPRDNKDPKHLAKLGRLFITKQLENYASLEGDENQVLDFALHMIKKDHLPLILKNISSMNQWIQSLAETETHDDNNTPFVSVLFAKGLTWEDF